MFRRAVCDHWFLLLQLTAPEVAVPTAPPTVDGSQVTLSIKGHPLYNSGNATQQQQSDRQLRLSELQLSPESSYLDGQDSGRIGTVPGSEGGAGAESVVGSEGGRHVVQRTGVGRRT